MNKKKFFATCTLVAFGATMMPALAFAVDTPVAATNSMKFAGTGSFTEALTTADKGLKVGVAGANAWADAKDTWSVEVVGGKDVSADFTGTITAAVTTQGSEADAYVVLKAKSAAILSQGTYKVTLKNTEKTDGQRGDETASFYLETQTPALAIKSSASITDGVISGNLNSITVNDGTVTGAKVYDLGTATYAQIAKGAKDVASVVTGGKVPTEKLVVGHTYALGGATISAATYPDEYFTYTQEVADAVAKVVEEAEKQVNADLAKIPAEITVEISGSTKIALNDATAQLGKTTLGLSGNNKVFIDSGSANIKKDVYPTLGEDEYSSDVTNKNINPVTVAAAIEDNDGKDLEETITVVIQNDDTKAISNTKTVKVILTGEKTASEKMAAYAAKYLQNYNAGKKSDTSDDTASLVVTKTGKAFSTDYGATFAIVDGGRDFVKCFNDNNIESLPEKDLTGKVGVSIGGGTITVDTTIKADGSSQPSDDEKVKEAAKAVNDSVTDFATVYAKVSGAGSTDGAAISDAEWAELQAAYLKVITAYTAYSALL